MKPRSGATQTARYETVPSARFCGETDLQQGCERQGDVAAGSSCKNRRLSALPLASAMTIFFVSFVGIVCIVVLFFRAQFRGDQRRVLGFVVHQPPLH